MEVADHITPVEQRPDLAFDPDNIQSLCATCHNSIKQALDKTGRVKGVDENGRPLDPNHWWNKGR